MADTNDLINAGVWDIEQEKFTALSSASHPSEIDWLGHVYFGNTCVELTGRDFLESDNGVLDKKRFVIDYDEYVPISQEYRDDAVSLRIKEISFIPPDNRVENNIDIPSYVLERGGFIERTDENTLSIDTFKKAVVEKLLNDNIISLDYVADYQHLKDTNKGYFQQIDKAHDYESVIEESKKRNIKNLQFDEENIDKLLAGEKREGDIIGSFTIEGNTFSAFVGYEPEMDCEVIGIDVYTGENINPAVEKPVGYSWVALNLDDFSIRDLTEVFKEASYYTEHYMPKVLADINNNEERIANTLGISGQVSEENEKKFIPKTSDELKKLVNDETIHLGDIDVRNIQDMSELFLDSERKDFSGIDTWDVSHVTDMSYMFYGTFMDEPIGKWDVSNVKDMSNMFAFSTFDQPIADWQVSNVENMYKMFSHSSFNQPIDSWDVSNVNDMGYMFEKSVFNHPIDSWDVSNVMKMPRMFADSLYNQPLNSWNPSKVVNMSCMFCGSDFNQPIENWDVSSVVEMDGMFMDSKFNQPLGKWNVSHAENMSEMFFNAPFNQPIDTWDMSNVKYMGNMFCGSDFNQPIDSWNIDNMVNMNNIFRESKFNQHIPSWKIDDYKELGFNSDRLTKPTSFEEGIKEIAKEHIKAGESLPEIGKKLKEAFNSVMLELGKAHIANKVNSTR